MCLACIEYTKDKMNETEFTFALRETTQADKAHYDEVLRLIKEYGGQPDELKKRLAELQARG